ncbi:hypothetical protein BHAMNSH16_03490 [Brachyspira hampsonii]|uniref:Uncharacterized protein n=2 Tax=Brachyspira hampsonii TaxID=1287055 RepID=A0AAC9TU28_9SPIR|nr:hypothetical protein BHAMNSH16_03490 [Brachyspira hampsonii]MBW5379947.1 hypothetical protein [Brachyspira hampsonii]OEJ14289.1 hypothetical protein A9496_01955 [Brachyspira hampsonii]
MYFGIYLFKVMDTNNIYQNMNIDLIKNLMEHYFLAIFIVSGISSVIIIGALNKFSGSLPTIIVIGILAFFMTLYPAYTVAFNKNIDYLRNELNDKTSLFIDDTGRYFTKIDNYLIKVGYKLLDNTYKNVILVDPAFMGKLYIGDYIYITDKEISLHEVKEISGTSVVEKTSSIFNRNSVENYISSFTADIIFGFEVFPLIVAFQKIITLTEMPIYAIALLFINLWIMLFAFYMLGLSLNSRQYVYHNILNALILYGIIKIIFAISIEQYNLLEVIIRNLNYWTMNLYIFIASLMTIVVSLALKKILNNDKKAVNNLETDKEH